MASTMSAAAAMTASSLFPQGDFELAVVGVNADNRSQDGRPIHVLWKKLDGTLKVIDCKGIDQLLQKQTWIFGCNWPSHVVLLRIHTDKSLYVPIAAFNNSGELLKNDNPYDALMASPGDWLKVVDEFAFQWAAPLVEPTVVFRAVWDACVQRASNLKYDQHWIKAGQLAILDSPGTCGNESYECIIEYSGRQVTPQVANILLEDLTRPEWGFVEAGLDLDKIKQQLQPNDAKEHPGFTFPRGLEKRLQAENKCAGTLLLEGHHLLLDEKLGEYDSYTGWTVPPKVAKLLLENIDAPEWGFKEAGLWRAKYQLETPSPHLLLDNKDLARLRAENNKPQLMSSLLMTGRHDRLDQLAGESVVLQPLQKQELCRHMLTYVFGHNYARDPRGMVIDPLVGKCKDWKIYWYPFARYFGARGPVTSLPEVSTPAIQSRAAANIENVLGPHAAFLQDVILHGVRPVTPLPHDEQETQPIDDGEAQQTAAAADEVEHKDDEPMDGEHKDATPVAVAGKRKDGDKAATGDDSVHHHHTATVVDRMHRIRGANKASRKATKAKPY